MKSYLVSLGMGALVGVIYSFLRVRSPAPPVIASVGLLGMLIGEQAAPIAKRVISNQAFTPSWLKLEQHWQHVVRIPVIMSDGEKPDDQRR